MEYKPVTEYDIQMSIPHAVEILKKLDIPIGEYRLREMCRQHLIPFSRYGRGYMVRIRDIFDYLRRGSKKG